MLATPLDHGPAIQLATVHDLVAQQQQAVRQSKERRLGHCQVRVNYLDHRRVRQHHGQIPRANRAQLAGADLLTRRLVKGNIALLQGEKERKREVKGEDN
jgi:hypothetical protein